MTNGRVVRWNGMSETIDKAIDKNTIFILKARSKSLKNIAKELEVTPLTDKESKKITKTIYLLSHDDTALSNLLFNAKKRIDAEKEVSKEKDIWGDDISDEEKQILNNRLRTMKKGD